MYVNKVQALIPALLWDMAASTLNEVSHGRTETAHTPPLIFLSPRGILCTDFPAGFLLLMPLKEASVNQYLVEAGK